MAERIRILIADDHSIVREGQRALIETEPDFELVGEAVDGEQTIRLAEELKPDIILLDMVMPNVDGLSAIEEIKRKNVDARILVLTSFSEDERVFAAVKAGALGYLLKDCTPQELITAIRDVYRGEPSMSPTVAQKVMLELQRSSNAGRKPTEEPLTIREIEVLTFIARGLSNQEIADQLMISEKTVRTHVSTILGKLHLANRTQAALYALKEGFASLE